MPRPPCLKGSVACLHWTSDSSVASMLLIVVLRSDEIEESFSKKSSEHCTDWQKCSNLQAPIQARNSPIACSGCFFPISAILSKSRHDFAMAVFTAELCEGVKGQPR